MINPYARIRQLEAELTIAVAAKIRLEDDNRAMHAQLVEAREAESKALQMVIDKSDRVQDWMASLMGKPPVNGTKYEKPEPPAPARRPLRHGAVLEQQAMVDMMSQLEREMGIEPVN